MKLFNALRGAAADNEPLLSQEAAGFQLGIAGNLEEMGRLAANTTLEKYQEWCKNGSFSADTGFKYQYFTIAVGGGNTVKALYRAWLEHLADHINWIEHVRFFFVQESTGESNWENASDSLSNTFLRPLATKLVERYGIKRVNEMLALPYPIMAEDAAEQITAAMVYRFDLDATASYLRAGKAPQAGRSAQQERRRYEALLREHLGESMACHLLVTGIGRNGGLGAFTPYSPALADKQPGVAVLKENGAIRVTLNRGAIVNAGCIVAMLAGSRKLMALGRFEMQESADFEQTVMETPVRMLRESPAICEKVYVFADDNALHFDEGELQYREDGQDISTKAEVRYGTEEDGVHVYLLHGFMGLYSYINFLIRLPGAWTVSALHRGSHAKKLPAADIFPHYAKALRKGILQNWNKRHPTAVGHHSIAGVICDHLLVSLVGSEEGPLPEFEQLKREDQKLIQALRSGGIVAMATWAPSDIVHINKTSRSLIGHWRRGEDLDYGGPQQVYQKDEHGQLHLVDPNLVLDNQPKRLLKFTLLPTVKQTVNALNRGIRYLMDRHDLQQSLSRREIPYGLRVIGGRLLRKVSFYGLLKEVSAALHEPLQYQQLHLRALDIIVKYDIPYLAIIHRDDFMVSAQRHREEHDYLMQQRMAKEGVKRAADLRTPLGFLELTRAEQKLPVDPLNPHLMLMSTSQEGDALSRQVTAAITEFVNTNVAAASAAGTVDRVASVQTWLSNRKSSRRSRKTA
ncbi:hypothetical protein EYC98_09440 [Halieaceae bacterium IMCC14734]|uniref:Glucosamine/galactosamine-6-phosphate isomerase domain-containing protein n=1 Tax=Candidatus Litorirhabdus singularis TaxID=2518993 RepID=A0ABT3TFJ8_9GAMM|nr:6-phosphogluconolactonase [Candidatus Litorirhabdus singularis]MCX2981086.1 hypothetical protein [Candidatus Litorirhabdus singularis]